MPLPADQRPPEYMQMIESVFAKIPFEGDMTENKTILEFAFKLYGADQATCLRFIDKIAQTAVKVIADDKCADMIEAKFKREVGAFIKSTII